MENLVLIPEKELKSLLSNQTKILRLLEDLSTQKSQSTSNFKYITEEEAKNILGKKSTWFWQQRTQGKFSYSKVGNTIFYKRSEIEKIFDDNFHEKF